MHLVGFIIRTDQAISAPNLFYDFTKFKVGCIYKRALISQQLFESIRDRQVFLSKCFDSSLKFVFLVYILWFASCTESKQIGIIPRETKLHEWSYNS